MKKLKTKLKMLSLKYEFKKRTEGFELVIGCDEVGRGCLAGPVVAGAVILPKVLVPELFDVKDSKLLSPTQRERLDKVIRDQAVTWGIGEVDEKIIDEINIHQASLLAMRRAVENLLQKINTQDTASLKRFFVCVDGKFIIPEFNMEQDAVVDGDAKILSVAAASIIAKVYRDTVMLQLHHQFPNYNFAQHKGYATFRHREAIKKFGLTSIHRRSFCRQYI